MQWNLENIRFLHPPDSFIGSFSNEKMQARHKALQEEKIEKITSALQNEKHPVKALQLLHILEHVKFLTNNVALFKEADCFEETVLKLYYYKNTPFAAAGDLKIWKSFFEQCDPDKIYSLGKPFPFTTTTAYSGSVTGIAKGLSWTVSKEELAWILDRWQDKDLGGGKVFSIEVSREDILVYVEKDRIREVILQPNILDKISPVVVTSV